MARSAGKVLVMRVGFGQLWLVILAISAVHAQTPAPEKLQFDVASVRQNMTSAKPTSAFSLDAGFTFSTVGKDDNFVPPGGVFSATNTSLINYISFAYKLTGTQFLAIRAWQLNFKEFAGDAAPMPKWTYGDRFDIQARAAGNPTRDQMREMMQVLLAKRFGLVVHKETRQLPIYALVLAKPGKPGPNLKPHPADDTCASDSPARGYPPVCGVLAHVAPSMPGRMSFGARAVTLDTLASALPTQTGMGTISRPVVDETGLTGPYDFILEWVAIAPDGTSTDPSGLLFQDALREQLGLKLEPKKGPVEILVIDKVEHPTAN